MPAVTLTPAQIQELTKKVNLELAHLNKITSHIPLRDIALAMNENGLDASDIQKYLGDNEGRISMEVGPEIYLHVSWHRYVSTGRFEILVYVTSNHDDYREPYSRTFTAAEKRKAKVKLNNKLAELPTYFPGKAAAFDAIQDAIAAAGFDYYEFQDATVAGRVNEDQRSMSVPIGHNTFVTVSWYRMDVTRNYEIVTYAS